MAKSRRFDKVVVGNRRFRETVDITDPCYNKDVWCRKNDVRIVPGEYDCVTWLSDEGEWGVRVGIIGIYLGGVVPLQKDMKCIGEIGVDAGLAGFFDDKPDYTDDEWLELCSKLDFNRDEKAWIFPEGFFSSSGFGDGCYDVYARVLEDGRATALEIRFL